MKILNLFFKILLIELPKDNKEFILSIKPLFDPEIPLYQNALCDMNSNIIQVNKYL